MRKLKTLGILIDYSKESAQIKIPTWDFLPYLVSTLIGFYPTHLMRTNLRSQELMKSTNFHTLKIIKMHLYIF